MAVKSTLQLDLSNHASSQPPQYASTHAMKCRVCSPQFVAVNRNTIQLGISSVQ